LVARGTGCTAGAQARARGATVADPAALAARIAAVLVDHDELRKPAYRGNPNPIAGHCFVAVEAFCHLTGGKGCVMQHEGGPHWFALLDGQVVDLTADQFATTPDYAQGRGCGFQSKRGQVSKRTAILLGLLAAS
jgi:hypothetical protein